MSFVQPDGAEGLWLVIAMLLLALTIGALVAAARRSQWGWFLACLFFGPMAAALYFAVGRHRDRGDSLTHP